MSICETEKNLNLTFMKIVFNILLNVFGIHVGVKYNDHLQLFKFITACAIKITHY